MRKTILITSVFCAAIAFDTTNAVLAEPSPRTPSKIEMSAILEEIKDAAKDPDSVHLKNVHSKDVSDELISFCGRVNAKNSFGGYAGFRPFSGYLMISDGKVTRIDISDIDNIELSTDLCRRDGFLP